MIESQLDAVRKRYPEAAVTPLPGGASLVTVPQFEVAPGWNAPRTTVRFMAPAGYPYAAPDCFWADETLRLENGQVPKNAAVNPIPDTSIRGLWFSWHLTQGWNPNVDSLLTWLASIASRFRAAQ
jgi:hypothetical protein